MISNSGVRPVRVPKNYERFDGRKLSLKDSTYSFAGSEGYYVLYTGAVKFRESEFEVRNATFLLNGTGKEEVTFLNGLIEGGELNNSRFCHGHVRRWVKALKNCIFENGTFFGEVIVHSSILGGAFCSGEIKECHVFDGLFRDNVDFNGGDFDGGVFKGDWLGGDFNGGEFLGTFHDGDFWGGTFGNNHTTPNWKGGRFHGGVWYDGVFSGGEFGLKPGCIWLGGKFSNGIWHDGDWRNGWMSKTDWRSGVFNAGLFLNGVFKGGEFVGDIFKDSVLEGGVFRGSALLNSRVLGGEVHGVYDLALTGGISGTEFSAGGVYHDTDGLSFSDGHFYFKEDASGLNAVLAERYDDSDASSFERRYYNMYKKFVGEPDLNEEYFSKTDRSLPEEEDPRLKREKERLNRRKNRDEKISEQKEEEFRRIEESRRLLDIEREKSRDKTYDHLHPSIRPRHPSLEPTVPERDSFGRAKSVIDGETKKPIEKKRSRLTNPNKKKKKDDSDDSLSNKTIDYSNVDVSIDSDL